MAPRKVSSRQNRTDIHINLKKLWGHTQDLHSYKPQVLAVWGGSILTPNQQAICNWYLSINCKKNQFSRVECHSVYQSHSRAAPMPRNGCPTLNKLKFCKHFVCFFLSLFLYFSFFSFVLLVFSLLNLLFSSMKFFYVCFLVFVFKFREREREKEIKWKHIVMWVRWLGEPGRNWRRGKHDQKILYETLQWKKQVKQCKLKNETQ